jgi:multidrug efflux pump subunit AcrB
LSNAVVVINRTIEGMDLPAGIRSSFEGTARVFEQSVANEPLLIMEAPATDYIVLGFLCKSCVHPFTILSTLRSAGVGSVPALMAFQTEFSLVWPIGLILLIGIVRKNAIIIIDFAFQAERADRARRSIGQPYCASARSCDDHRSAGGHATTRACGRCRGGAATCARHFGRPD